MFNLNVVPSNFEVALEPLMSRRVICACIMKGKPYKTLIGRSLVSPNIVMAWGEPFVEKGI